MKVSEKEQTFVTYSSNLFFLLNIKLRDSSLLMDNFFFFGGGKQEEQRRNENVFLPQPTSKRLFKTLKPQTNCPCHFTSRPAEEADHVTARHHPKDQVSLRTFLRFLMHTLQASSP